MNHKFRTAKFKVLTLIALLQCASAVFGLAQDPGTWRVLIEPGFMRPPVSHPIAGAQRTVLAAAYLKDDEPVYFSQKQFRKLGLSWEQFVQRASNNASSKTLRAEFASGKNQVIEYATFRSPSQLTATAILSPDLYQTMVGIFGPKFLIAAPNRFTFYIFPSLLGRYQDYASQLLEQYQSSTYPVSSELFELSEKGLRAVGTFEAGSGPAPAPR